MYANGQTESTANLQHTALWVVKSKIDMFI